MQFPKRLQWLRVPPPRSAEANAEKREGSAAPVPQAPESAEADDSDVHKPPSASWQNTELGFLDAQLGDQARMDRYNVLLIIKTLHRCVTVALGFTVSMAGTAAYVARTSGSDKGGVILTLVVLAGVGMIVALTAVFGMARLSLRQRESVSEEIDP